MGCRTCAAIWPAPGCASRPRATNLTHESFSPARKRKRKRKKVVSVPTLAGKVFVFPTYLLKMCSKYSTKNSSSQLLSRRALIVSFISTNYPTIRLHRVYCKPQHSSYLHLGLTIALIAEVRASARK
jgi:hypothetical protein